MHNSRFKTLCRHIGRGKNTRNSSRALCGKSAGTARRRDSGVIACHASLRLCIESENFSFSRSQGDSNRESLPCSTPRKCVSVNKGCPKRCQSRSICRRLKPESTPAPGVATEMHWDAACLKPGAMGLAFKGSASERTRCIKALNKTS